MTVVQARTLDEALIALDNMPSALVLQGGTDSMVAINFGRTRPEAVVAIRNVSELREWRREDDGSLFIGSGLPYAAMETGELASLLPALAQAARTVGSPQIRAAGTIGGNLGTCSPAGDALPVLSAFDATIELRSIHETRNVPFAQFMIGPKRSIRRNNEIITGIRIMPTRGFQGYAKVGVRNAMVISVASVCLVVDEVTMHGRIALGSVGPTIIRCHEAESLLASAHKGADSWVVSTQTARTVAESASAAAKPIDDHRSTAAYRSHAVTVLTQRLLERSNHV